MRPAVACLVLAAAIATPGIVIAATSSGRHSSLLGGTASSASIVAAPLRSQPIDPALRPVVDAVEEAFNAKGVRLKVISGRPGQADAVQSQVSTRCPVFIVFQLIRQSTNTLFGTSCGTGSMKIGRVTITYSPPSIGPTIRRAVSGLAR